MLKTITLFLLLQISLSVLAQQEVKVCFLDIGFGKYSNKELTGIWQRKIINALEKSNGKLTPIFSPRERCVYQIKDNSVDAIVAAYSKDYTDLIAFPLNTKNEADKNKRIGVIKYFIYKHQNSKATWDGKKITSLASKKVGVQRSLYSRPIFEHIGVQNFEEVNTVTQGIDKVSYQRNEVFIGEEQQSDLAMKNLKHKNVVKLPITFYEDDLYVVFTKKFYEKNAQFVEKFWSELEKLKNNKDFLDAFNTFEGANIHELNLSYLE